MPQISVVIPTYNAAPFIRQTLDSVFAQTYLPCEVLVVDDCSTDTTVSIVEELAAESPIPLRLIRLPKNTGGPAKPLNVGIEAARGEYIATLDQDDLFLPSKLRCSLDALAVSSQAGLCSAQLFCSGPNAQLCQDVERWFACLHGQLPKVQLSGTAHIVSQPWALRSVIASKCFVATCSNMVFPKAVWRDVGGFDSRLSLSCDFGFLAQVARARDVLFLTEPLIVWRLHSASLYQVGVSFRKFSDLLRVYDGINKLSLSSADRHLLLQVVRELAYDACRQFRADKRFVDGWKCLFRSLQVVGLWREALTESIKILHAQLLSSWELLRRSA